jgi:hypothetical protein
MEHLTEKAGPTTSEWLNKAKDTVEHLSEKAGPTTTDWLNKAKELGNDLSTKGGSLLSPETLAKGSATLAALAAGTKELAEKFTSNPQQAESEPEKEKPKTDQAPPPKSDGT